MRETAEMAKPLIPINSTVKLIVFDIRNMCYRKKDDFTAMKYSADGVYYSESKEINPDKVYVADANEVVVIDFKNHSNVEFVLMVESYHVVTKLKAFMYFEKADFA